MGRYSYVTMTADERRFDATDLGGDAVDDVLIDDVLIDDSDAAAASRGRRLSIACVVAFVWLRSMYVLISRPFLTPDTASYRSGQMTRPPLGAALLSWLGDRPYVALSVVVSSLGFAALAWALWNPARRRRSMAVTTAIVVYAFIPSITVYEHWLVPDSLMVGFALMALALAWRRVPTRWHSAALVVLCLATTTTKEQGIGLVLLIALVLLVRRCWRVALVALAASALLFATTVMPAANRHGTVIWHEPADTQMTMARFRVVIASLMWPDLSPKMAEVSRLSGECGMTMSQLVLETFNLTNRRVDFRNCPELWTAVDQVSQVDVVLAHLHQSRHVPLTIERGFAPNMWAMSLWSQAPFTQRPLMSVDRWLDGFASVLPFIAVALALWRRRGRRLAAIAVLATAMAFASALVDPSGQDRHTVAFRVLAFGIALMSLTESTAPRRAAIDEPDVDGDPIVSDELSEKLVQI